MLPERAEAVIIGGGVIGASTAYFLASQGVGVVLVDKGDRAGEASAANAAWVWSLTRRPGIDIQLAEHSIAIHHQLHRELALDTEYQPVGGLLVATEEEELPHLEEHARAREACGSPVTVLGPRETREQEPLLTERVRGSLYSPESGCTNPIRLTLGLLEAAESRSARIFNRTEVLDIETASGAVRAVVTDRGRIATDLVINAAGSWAGRVGQMVGLEVPVSPYRMGLLVTEPLPRTFSRVIMGASYMVAENEKADLADKSRFGSGLVASQQTSGNLLLGATWREAGFDKRSDFEEIRAIAAENLRFFPSLRPVRIIRSFANFFPFTADDLPILGRVKKPAGFIMAAGHNGHGICLGPGSGKLIQELITQGQTSLPLDELRLDRFQR